jgi:phosphopantothenate synthetase
MKAFILSIYFIFIYNIFLLSLHYKKKINISTFSTDNQRVTKIKSTLNQQTDDRKELQYSKTLKKQRLHSIEDSRCCTRENQGWCNKELS